MSIAPPTRDRRAASAVPDALHAALASGERPPRPGPLAAALAFGWRGMLKVKHVPEQLLDVTITPVLFLLMFTYLFGGALAGSTREYLQYLLPGMLVQSVVFTAVYSGVALNTDVTKGVVDRFRSLAIWRPHRSWALCSATASATRWPPPWSSCSGSSWASVPRRASPACSPRCCSSSSSPSACRGRSPSSAWSCGRRARS